MKNVSRLMSIGIAALTLGGSHKAMAQLPFCPPFCHVKADSGAKPKSQEPVKAAPQKKARKAKKQISA